MTVSGSSSTEDEPTESWVYDFDTRLALPCVLEDYIFNTFLDVPPRYERIIPGDVFLKQFASDRSHMVNFFTSFNAHMPEYSELVVKDDGGVSQTNDPGVDKVYISPPPSYEPICGTGAAEKGVVNNLMSSFVDMVSSERTFGRVIDRTAMSTLMWS
ncbi:hypothetical protein C0995_006932 [Termitomyces sp. Mi166|nr:hypothetical protein C0995_006932 [Termitomyces sp. Mi166\